MTDEVLIVASGGADHHVSCDVMGKVPTGTFELVFTTTMSAYIEPCTDPSYRDQALVFSYPVIGAHGIPLGVNQSHDVQPAMVIVAAPTQAFITAIVNGGGCVVSIADTRAIVTLARNGATARLAGQDSARVLPTPRRTLQRSARSGEVIMVDFGCKSAIAAMLEQRGLSIITVDPGELNPGMVTGAKGIVLSNGPGDPRQDRTGASAAAVAIASGIPTLGICYGHQLLAIANGCNIVPLRCGHRGTNHPIVNVRTGRVSITSHNHGFTVSDSLRSGTLTTYRSMLDGTIEGIERDNFAGVQFHPEGAPGPHLDEVMDSFSAAITKAQRST